jgi:hypothetical protein
MLRGDEARRAACRLSLTVFVVLLRPAYGFVEQDGADANADPNPNAASTATTTMAAAAATHMAGIGGR